MIYYHDGIEDFPHGAGASDAGWYVYVEMSHAPDGPFAEYGEAVRHLAALLRETP